MTNDEPVDLKPELQAIAQTVRTVAQKCQGNCLTLLALLRTLEQVHREIQEGMFQSSLPDNRQALYALLKDIEEEGGWPYIDRMRLRSLLVNLSDFEPESKSESESESK